MTPEEKHSLRSSEREEYVEYIFLANLCAYGWANDRFVEVARSKTDAFGYDLVLSSGTMTRHVQLKASRSAGKARSQKINTALCQKPSGCAIWLKVDDRTLTPEVYGWKGGPPGVALGDLGDRIAKHTKGNAQGTKALRPAIREVAWHEFQHLTHIGEVFTALFGLKDDMPCPP